MNRGRGGRIPSERKGFAPGGRGRGRGPSPTQRYVPVVTKGSSSNNGELLHTGNQKSWTKIDGCLSKQGSHVSLSNCSYQQDCSLGGIEDISSDIKKLKLVEHSTGTTVNTPLQPNCFNGSVPRSDKRDREVTAQSKFRDRDQNTWKTPKAQPVKLEGSNSSLQFDCSPASNDASTQVKLQNSCTETEGSLSKQGGNVWPSNCSYQQDCSMGGTEDVSSDIKKFRLGEHCTGTVANSPMQPSCFHVSVPKSDKRAREVTDQSKFRDRDHNSWKTPKAQPVKLQGSNSSLQFDCSPASNDSSTQDDPSLLVEAGDPTRFPERVVQCEQPPDEKASDGCGSENSDGQSKRVIFDICPAPTGSALTLKASLHELNRLKRNEIKRSIEGQSISELRSGMLLLKGYLSFNEQVELVNSCRDLSRGLGGFYEPGYRDGGKLHLKMMCLGKNWDPETSKYGDKRPADGAKPPLIPGDFLQLVKRAIQESHSFLKGRSKTCKAEDVLPSMNPNICIVNFYTKSGRLGLHQDKDESSESIHRGLPVVSLSIGDSAEFLYSDHRDLDRAEKVILESGDALIFGGKSRLVFHGVSTIVPESVPKALIAETHMRPGRLNLTFRQY